MNEELDSKMKLIFQTEDSTKDYEGKMSIVMSKILDLEKEVSRKEANLNRINSQYDLYGQTLKTETEKIYNLGRSKIEQDSEISKLNFNIKALKMELQKKKYGHQTKIRKKKRISQRSHRKSQKKTREISPRLSRRRRYFSRRIARLIFRKND